MRNAALRWVVDVCKRFPIALVMILSFLCNIVGITWGLPHYVDWEADSIVPFHVLEAIHKRFSHGWFDAYPPVHHLTLAVICAPFLAYILLSGGLKEPSQIFPFGLTDPLFTLTTVILIARMVSVLMGVGIVFLVYRLVCELFDKRSALFSALIVALAYPLVFYSHQANVDVPYIFWMLLALYHFLQVLKQGDLKSYIWFALLSTLTICTKDQAYGLFLLSPLPILWRRFVDNAQSPPPRPSWLGVLVDRRHLIAIIVAIATFVVAHNLLFNFSGFINHLELISSPGQSNPHQYQIAPFERLRILWQTISFLASGFTLPLFGVCLAGSIYCSFKYPKYTLPLLFLAASYYLLFINYVLFVHLRYILPIGIIMAFFGGKWLADIWFQKRWKTPLRAAICLAFVYALLFPIQLDVLFLKTRGTRRKRGCRNIFKTGTSSRPFRLTAFINTTRASHAARKSGAVSLSWAPSGSRSPSIRCACRISI